MAQPGSRDTQRQSNDVLRAVLFAVALFLAGMGTKLDRRGLRRMLRARAGSRRAGAGGCDLMS